MKTNLIFKNLSIFFFAFWALTACKKNESGPTANLPEIVTNEVTGFNISTSTLSAKITQTGGANITQCGFVWSSTEAMPTLQNKEGFTQEGAHNDQFSHLAPNFSANKTYYIRAYATNSKGTAYGDAILVVFDASNNLYHTIKIGNQVWMLENLRTQKYNDNVDITSLSSNTDWSNLQTAALCWYDNNYALNGPVYGALYNGFAMLNSKIAPSGWKVPSDSDWQTLIDNLGGEIVAGKKMKESGFQHWEFINGIQATNESGFSALPAGYRDGSGLYLNLHSSAYFWSSTPGVTYGSNHMISLYSYDDAPLKDSFNWFAGLSIRCLKQ
jgi:uncharacterized protein (TIGR02145 family)